MEWFVVDLLPVSGRQAKKGLGVGFDKQYEGGGA